LKIAGLSLRFLMRVGVTTAKVRTIQNLAAWFRSNRKLAKSLPRLADDEIVARLTAIPGIGAWTVNVFLIFNLGRPDVMPAGDLGIRRSVQLADKLRAVATPKQVLERSQAWRPYRSIASIYLWQATKLKLKAKDI
jgi:3-methyladenine DNA glycosylase/8-oxoguanine DNA glycosylase